MIELSKREEIKEFIASLKLLTYHKSNAGEKKKLFFFRQPHIICLSNKNKFSPMC